VAVRVVSSTPHGIVRVVTASPELSRVSPNYGEQLKGIAITVSLRNRAPPATVVLDLRQVCAEYFRNTFLYYLGRYGLELHAVGQRPVDDQVGAGDEAGARARQKDDRVGDLLGGAHAPHRV